MTIPFFTLIRQQRNIKGEIDGVLRQVFATGVYILGENVAAFEHEFARFIGVPYAVGVASGTDAILLSLRALDIGSGDEVIIPANVYPTAFPVAVSGAIPMLVDCRDDGNLDLEKLSAAITKKTRAIIPVHLYGNPAPLAAIRSMVSKKRAITLIEDAAQAHGTKVQSSKFKVQSSPMAGAIGDVGCFSFYPTKNLGAYGDGGMVVSRDKRIIDRIRRLRMYGEVDRYRSTEVSGVSRLDELQAAILRVKLKHLDAWVGRRRTIARFYNRELHGVGDIRPLSSLSDASQASFHLYVIRTSSRDRLASYLKSLEIGTGVHYPVPVHLTRAFRYLGYKKGDFPVSEKLCREILSLPLYPELTDAEAETVVTAVKKFFRL